MLWVRAGGLEEWGGDIPVKEKAWQRQDGRKFRCVWGTVKHLPLSRVGCTYERNKAGDRLGLEVIAQALNAKARSLNHVWLVEAPKSLLPPRANYFVGWLFPWVGVELKIYSATRWNGKEGFTQEQVGIRSQGAKWEGQWVENDSKEPPRVEGFLLKAGQGHMYQGPDEKFDRILRENRYQGWGILSKLTQQYFY